MKNILCLAVFGVGLMTLGLMGCRGTFPTVPIEKPPVFFGTFTNTPVPSATVTVGSTNTPSVSVTITPGVTATVTHGITSGPSYPSTPTPTSTLAVTFTRIPTSTNTPVPTATIVAGCGNNFGNPPTGAWNPVEQIHSFNSGINRIAAARYNLPLYGTITSLSAVLPASTPDAITSGEVRMAIYANAAGNTPGDLIVESVPVPYVQGKTLYTAAITPTNLYAGDYWLAVQGTVIGTLSGSGGITWGDLYLDYSSSDGNGVDEDWTYGSFPANLVPTSATGRQYVLYANYCSGPATFSASIK